jgi:puromycin-sensitive aminopeptidase
MTDATRSDYRLPNSVLPSAYRLRIEPDLEVLTFAGRVEIDVEIGTPVSEIVLNAIGLEVGEGHVVLPDGELRVAELSFDEGRERMSMALDRELGAGPAVLVLRFSGILSDSLVGLYRSTFTDGDGRERTIATSQLALTEARRVFPCFDEPALKATFSITIVAPDGLPAYSNSPIESEKVLPDGRREVTFETTMKMSTYLVALVVGPLVATEVVDVDGVPMSVVCTPGKEHLVRFALEIGAFSLRFFSDYFAIPYPGEKLDLVGVPDFAYGAMENVGCIIFRESLLLVDEETASTDDLQRVAAVVAHEIAHQWFGNLVTMEWWEGFWLNEAFATFLMYICTDAFRPEWRTWDRFSEQRELGLAIDGLHTTRPIEFEVRSPAEATAMADAITYQKGGSVLRMLEQYLGPETYRDAVRAYLRKHSYANTVTADLWEALEQESGQPVGEIMDTWILQGGHPVVSVSGGMLSQKPFMLSPAEGPSSIGTAWLVPILSRPLGGTDVARQLLGDTPAALLTEWPAVVNAGGSGVYRTSYGPEELGVIAGSAGSLSDLELVVLLADTWALAQAGDRSIGDLLTLASGLGTRVEPSAWGVVERALGFLSRIVDDAQRPALAAKARALIAPALANLGWDGADGEDERAQQVRAILIRALGTTGEDAEVRAEATARFDAGALEGDLADTIVSVVASLDRPGDRDEMIRRFRGAKDPQTEQRYRSGIVAIADEQLAVQTFRELFDLFRTQDGPYLVAMLVSNRVGGRAVWEQLAAHWDETLAKTPPLMQFALGAGVAGFVGDRAFAERVADFHRTHPVAAGQPRIDQAVERMLNGVRFADRERPLLDETLS